VKYTNKQGYKYIVTKKPAKEGLLKLSKTSRIVTAFSRHKKPDKESLLKLSLTVFIVTTFSESQNRHKWSYLRPSQCDGFCNIKLAVTKSLKKS
jgi:hypothetical protein